MCPGEGCLCRPPAPLPAPSPLSEAGGDCVCVLMPVGEYLFLVPLCGGAFVSTWEVCKTECIDTSISCHGSPRACALSLCIVGP